MSVLRVGLGDSRQKGCLRESKELQGSVWGPERIQMGSKGFKRIQLRS